MAGTRDIYRIARVALTASAAMLVVSIAITYLIGASRLSTAESSASDTARVLVQENLATYVTGEDLVAPVGESRARELDDLIDGAVLNGEIDAVTIWEPDGTIVFSSDAGLIGTRLPEERFPLRDVLKEGTSSEVKDGMFSTRVPLAPAGTDAEAVAQLDRVYAPIWDTTAKPWRTASLSLGLVLLLVLGAIYQVSRMASRRWKTFAGTTFQAIRGRRSPELGGGDGTDPAYAHPDFRKAEEELASATVRATTAEERAAALQEQYRKTLEELHAVQTKLKGAALETPSRPDPEFEERLLKAEGRARLLEGQLQSVKTERDNLAKDARERPAETAPDPKIEQRARSAEAVVASLRSELEIARAEVVGIAGELESTRRERQELADRDTDAGRLRAAAEAVGAEAAQTRGELDSARTELDSAKTELATASDALASARTELEQLATVQGRAAEAEQRLAQLDERSRSLEADLAQARSAAEGRTDEAQAAAEARTAEAQSRASQAEVRAAEEAARADRIAQTLAALQTSTEAEALQVRALADAEVANAERRVEAAETRVQEIETAATSDVKNAVARLEAANAGAAEIQVALEAAQRDASSAHAERDDLRTKLESATIGLVTSDSDLEATRAVVDRLEAEGGGAKAELQKVWSELETAQQELTAALDRIRRDEASLEAASAEARALRSGSDDAEDALRAAREESDRLGRELVEARDALARTSTEVRAELERTTEVAERVGAAELGLREAMARADAAEHDAEQLHREMEISGHELATLREIADAQAVTAKERASLEEMLRVTQEHLSGSNDRAAEVEARNENSELALVAARIQVEELEARLRQTEMSQAVRAMRRDDAEPADGVPAAPAAEAPREDRRASSPFMQELSLDAKKSLTSILGLSLALKHKNQPKEQAPLLRQLASYARRLDHTVADLLDADRLAKGEVELHVRRTDLEALVQRVVEDSQVGNDHDVRLQTTRIVAAIDPVRTEQLLMGLLRGATDRTPLGSAITIRLTKGEGGALISVEDMEVSSDATLSPVVARFADIQGGWAKVESRPNGGSAFRVFLPAEGVTPDSSDAGSEPEIELSLSAPRTGLEIVVSDELDADRALSMAAEDDDPWAAGQLLVQELQKLSRDD